LLKRTDILPVIYESTSYIRGIARTVNHNGNRIDIGGHRFFSKSSRVMDWWMKVFPLQGSPSIEEIKLGVDMKNKYVKSKEGHSPEKTDNVMLIRNRISRIFFLRKFFNYPVSFNLQTLMNLGPFRVIKIGFSYIRTIVFPIKNEQSLEDFFINRFGRKLYELFFKDYTEKVWGVPCNKIGSEWGAQRIKGLSIMNALKHAFKKVFCIRGKNIEQKKTETSLIEQFLYPKYGPGQLWEKVASEIKSAGGQIFLNTTITKLSKNHNEINSVVIKV